MGTIISCLSSWVKEKWAKWFGKANIVIAPISPTTNSEVTVNTGKRYAILAGSNFVGTPNQLRGCINDLINVRKLIENSGIIILADLRDADMSTANWKAALTNAAAIAEAGDVVFHMHSHHGAQVKDNSEEDGLAEIWCPNDFDFSPARMITDKWMASMIASLKPGVQWIDWADCCHAADSIRQLWCPGEQPRFISNPALNDFEAKRLIPMVVAGQDRKGVLLAACRSSQTSADARINGEHCGAFSHFLLQSLNEMPNGTYEELLLRTTQHLGLGGYDQKPELDCKLGDEKSKFAFDILGKTA